MPRRPHPVVLSRRRLLGAGAGLGAGLVLAACGDSASPAASGGDEVDADAGTDWPVEVEHAYGTTEVPGPPSRVVSVGVTEQDFLLALGVTPVGITEWYNEEPFATWPWATDELGDAEPTVLFQTDGLDFEAIAALAPDLLVGTNAGLEQADYDKLSQIAPTIAHSGDHEMYFEPWPVQLAAIGAAVGKADSAAAVTDEVKARFADAAAAHPEFDGVSAIFLQGGFYEGSAIAYQAGLSTEFLTDLGFTVPEGLDEFQQGGGQAYVPKERMIDVLDVADVLVWATESDSMRADLEADPVFQQLKATREGRNVYTDEVLAGAVYFASPLSLPYVVDELVPRLSDVLA